MPTLDFAKRLLFLLFTLSLSTTVKAVPETQKIDKKEQEKAIIRISKLLNEKYVYPKLAKKCSEYLNTKFYSGGYAQLNDLDEFVEEVVKDLHATSNDQHISIRLSNHKDKLLNKRDPEVVQILQRKKEKSDNYGFEKAEIMDGNVGYLKFNYFSGHDSATDTAAAMMKFVSNADALIIDLRNNIGGSSEMLQFMLSYFFEGKTLLSHTTVRGSNVPQGFWTLNDSPGKKMDKLPIFILTSGKTYSASEAFSYYLKVHERATLVGEVTAGLANAGNTFRVNPNLRIFIPTKLIISPITKTNWSRIGVVPHIKVPVDTAFDKAYELARFEGEKYGNIQSEGKIRAIKNSVLSFQEAYKTLSIVDTEKFVNGILDTLLTNWGLDETSLNDMGYRYLQLHNNPTVASIVFKYNSVLHPKSYNVYGSLADSYVDLGEFKLAIENYEKALIIEPDDRYSQARLKKLRVKGK